MASNDNKKKARRLQQENPGMKYTEALRHIEAGMGADLIHFGTSLEYGREVFLDLSGDLVATSIHFTMKAPEDSRAALSDALDRLDVGGRAPWPLQVGADLSDGTPAVLFPLEADGNLAVCGNAGAGHIATLRPLARSAIAQGWSVTIMGNTGAEYEDLHARHPQKVSTLPGGRFHSEEERAEFYAGMRPGTEREPRLFIIDNGDRRFDYGSETEQDEWVSALESLMAQPHTAVVLQSTSFSRALIPARIIRHLNSRLLLGRSAEHTQRVVFQDVVPQETLDAFDFSQPAWTGTAADRDRGVLWDGERLVRVAHDPLDSQ